MGTTQISVMGCGCLGLPLAQELVRQGYGVNGSTTSPEKMTKLHTAGIQPFLLSFPEIESKTLGDFLQAEVLVFNIPPSKTLQVEGAYERMLQAILEAAPTRLRNVLFVSSTSVYPDLNREVTEADALPSPSAESLLLRSEALLQQQTGISITVVRMAGLMGGQRHPGRWLAGKTDVPQPLAPVNMIHLTDCVQLLTQIIRQEKWGFTFNACAPRHPSRQVFYTQAAQALQLTPPVFQPAASSSSFKSVNANYLQETLGYAFRFPDPLACLSDPAF